MAAILPSSTGIESPLLLQSSTSLQGLKRRTNSDESIASTASSFENDGGDVSAEDARGPQAALVALRSRVQEAAQLFDPNTLLASPRSMSSQHMIDDSSSIRSSSLTSPNTSQHIVSSNIIRNNSVSSEADDFITASDNSSNSSEASVTAIHVGNLSSPARRTAKNHRKSSISNSSDNTAR